MSHDKSYPASTEFDQQPPEFSLLPGSTIMQVMGAILDRYDLKTYTSIRQALGFIPEIDQVNSGVALGAEDYERELTEEDLQRIIEVVQKYDMFKQVSESAGGPKSLSKKQLPKLYTNVVTSEILSTNPDFKDGAMAVDPATIAMAFRKLSEHVGTPLSELEPTPEGVTLFEGLAGYNDSDFAIHDTVADAGDEGRRDAMNNVAKQHGFDAPFEKSFASNEVGILSIVDKEIQWHSGDAEKTTMHVSNGESSQAVEAVQFKLEFNNDDHFSVYSISRFQKPVVRIAANPDKSDGVQNFMWATEVSPSQNLSPIEIFTAVKETVDTVGQADTRRYGAAEVASITLPKLQDVEYERDWTEIEGAHLGDWRVGQAKQAVRVSIDEVGAKAAAVVSMVAASRSMVSDTEPRDRIKIGNDGPMLVWFTEGDSRLPICAMVTNLEAWQPAQ